MAAALADRRCVSGLISFADPAGNRLEAFHGPQVADTPFRPGRMISGFRCGPLGMGHVLMTTTDMAASLRFYRDLLGFRISDFMRAPMQAYFMHVNARHHSLALVEAPVDTLHHLMVEMYSLDDVGQGYDLALADGADLEVMRRDAQRMRGDRPFVFTNLKTGEGVSEVMAWIERDVLFLAQ